MTIQYINVGTNANDGTGEDLRSAFFKVNANFQELDSRGGETNTAADIGSGVGITGAKTGTTLNFKSLVAGGGVSITADPNGSIVTISSTAASPNTISTIVGNSGSWNITQPNSTLQILGQGTTLTSVSGNQIYITSSFSLADDVLPKLGENLDLNGFDIGNIGDNLDQPTEGNISIDGYITANNLTIGRPYTGFPNPGSVTVHGSLTVGGSTQIASLISTGISVTGNINSTTITANNSITAPTIGSILGTSDIYGTLVGNINSLFNNTVEVLNTEGPNATFTGNVIGSLSGNYTGTFVGAVALNGQQITGSGYIDIENTSLDSRSPLTISTNYFSTPQTGVAPLVTDGSASPIFSVVAQSGYGYTESLRLRSTQLNSTETVKVGTGILFESTNEITEPEPGQAPEYTLHGWLSMQTYSDPDFSDLVVRVRGIGTGTVFDNLVVSGDERIHASGITINRGVISNRQLYFNQAGVPGTIDEDLTLTNFATGKYVNMYGAYKFPKTIGTPGQVLTVPTPGATPDPLVLVWGDGGSGGSSVLTIDGMLVGQSPIQVSTTEQHGLIDSTLVTITDTGVPQLDGNSYYANVTDSYTFLLYSDDTLSTPVNGTTYGAYTGGGYVSAGASSGGAKYFTSLLDVPSTYSGQAEKIVRVNGAGTGLEFASNISATVTGSLVGNATTATSLQNSRTINGVGFNGTANITFGTDAVSEGTNNLYFTPTRARDSISVTPSKSISYTAGTGVFDLAESISSTASTLVKRDSSGKIHALTVYTDTLSVDAALTITVANNLTGAFDLTTSGIVSATNFVTTGTGDPTIESAGKIVLAPTTFIDVSSKKISNLATPTANTDASTKAYVDTAVSTVDTAAVKSNIYNADSGGPITVTKGSTLTIEGGTNINAVASTNKITINLDSTLTNISQVTGNLPVTGNVTSSTGFIKAGNVKIDGDAVTQTQSATDLNLVPGAGGAVAISSYFNLLGTTMSITGYDTLTVANTSTPVTVDLTTNLTFVRTLDATLSVGLANAQIDSGREGQIKTIILESRGVYGDALDTRPRYLVLSGNINGASRQVNIGVVDPNGSATFIYLNNYWWRISQVA